MIRLSYSRTTDSPSAAKSAEFGFCLAPRVAACALLAVSTVLTMGLAVAAPVFAQTRVADDTTSRSVQGTVTDSSDKSVEGAVVQIKDTKSLQIRSFVTQADGMYHFHGLNSNVDYELRAERQGASSGAKTLSSFDSRKSAVINLKMGK